MVYKKKTANWPGFVCRLLGHVIIYLYTLKNIRIFHIASKSPLFYANIVQQHVCTFDSGDQ